MFKMSKNHFICDLWSTVYVQLTYKPVNVFDNFSLTVNNLKVLCKETKVI